jgi:hypothetical protein
MPSHDFVLGADEGSRIADLSKKNVQGYVLASCSQHAIFNYLGFYQSRNQIGTK